MPLTLGMHGSAHAINPLQHALHSTLYNTQHPTETLVICFLLIAIVVWGQLIIAQLCTYRTYHTYWRSIVYLGLAVGPKLQLGDLLY